MERHKRVRNVIQNLTREMQTGGGRGDRARRVRKNRLITRLILRVTLASDVRRQRHGTSGIKIGIFIQGHNPLALRQDFFNAHDDMVDPGCGADAKFSTGFGQTFPARASETLDKQKLDRAIIGKFSRWNYACVVQNKQIPRTEQRF